MKGFITFAAMMIVVLMSGCLTQGDYPVISDVFRGNLSVVGEPIVNRTVELVFSIEPRTDLTNATIKIVLPDCIKHVGGEVKWNGDVKKR